MIDSRKGAVVFDTATVLWEYDSLCAKWEGARR